MKPIVLFTLLAIGSAGAEPALKNRLKDQHGQGQQGWIYNDLAAAFARAKADNMPLLVTFRCVPCKACMEFDGLAAGASPKLKSLADKFVTIRQVEMKGVDLSQFQFDYDLNWAAMFLNADGTVYARYGTQSEEGPDAFNSVDSLAATMERVLDLHEDYPANRKRFAGKTGRKKPYRTALEMPGLPHKDRYRKQTEVSNCIHCHNVHDAENFELYDTGKLKREMLWRYPLPANIGLRMDRKDGTRIEKVDPGSRAAKAGITAGEQVLFMNGQAITSIADMQWVLHNLPQENATLQIKSLGDSGGRTIELILDKGWKRTDISWRGSLWALPPSMKVYLPPANDAERKRQGLPKGVDALAVRWINKGEKAGQAASKAGLRMGDLVVEVGGQPVPKGGHREFNMFVKMRYSPGEKLPLTLFRDGKRVKLELPLVR